MNFLFRSMIKCTAGAA